jgi:hypothetical protein
MSQPRRANSGQYDGTARHGKQSEVTSQETLSYSSLFFLLFVILLGAADDGTRSRAFGRSRPSDSTDRRAGRCTFRSTTVILSARRRCGKRRKWQHSANGQDLGFLANIRCFSPMMGLDWSERSQSDKNGAYIRQEQVDSRQIGCVDDGLG